MLEIDGEGNHVQGSRAAENFENLEELFWFLWSKYCRNLDTFGEILTLFLCFLVLFILVLFILVLFFVWADRQEKKVPKKKVPKLFPRKKKYQNFRGFGTFFARNASLFWEKFGTLAERLV